MSLIIGTHNLGHFRLLLTLGHWILGSMGLCLWSVDQSHTSEDCIPYMQAETILMLVLGAHNDSFNHVLKVDNAQHDRHR